MALLLLILIGAVLGWLASVVMRTERPTIIMRQIGVGLLVAVGVGLFTNSGTFLGGLSLFALGAAVAATIGALALYHLLARRKAADE